MLRSGGVERWLTDLCPAGKAENVSMDIAVVHSGDGLFDRRARELGIPVHHCAGSANPLRFLMNLRGILRDFGPFDAVHSHLHAYSGFVVLGAWLSGVPARVVHSHNVVANDSRPLPRRLYIGLARTLIRLFATAGMGPSIASTEDLLGKSWRKDSRWRVMRCGINLEPFETPVPANVNRTAFGIPEDSLVFGSIGRLCAEKNSEFLVDVLASALATNPKTYLVMIGEGPLRTVLEEKARALGISDQLKLAGTRTDIADVLRGVIDVFLFPSPPPPRGNEALPIAVIEAQAAGVPTVIGDGVTTEAIVTARLVRQVSADAGPRAWADAALEQAKLGSAENRRLALAELENSEFNCARNVKLLAQIYRNR
ncbi:MAG: glycosyltransferase [Bryobacterales bacterium]|nr:glycosyltransferase [Bryobacterales bacterium]